MKISQCFNPSCLGKNPPDNQVCKMCGAKLLLSDRYRAVSYIGEGGLSRTFLAVDSQAKNTPCVIKQYIPSNQTQANLQQLTKQFKLEVVRLLELGKKQAQIPKVLNLLVQDGKIYLILQYIQGKDLRKQLNEKGKFSEQEVKHILAKLLPVLHSIHQQGIIHQDIKPESIIMGQDGSLVLTDFGVFKHLMSAATGTIPINPGYAAPEQMRGMFDPATDLYSLGVTAVRLLTGCLPKEENGKISDPIFDPIHMSWTWEEWCQEKEIIVSDGLSSVLQKLLREHIKHRFHSAAEVFKALKNPPTETQPPPTTKISPRKPQIELKSAVGIDYTKLRDHLAVGRWKEADEETYEIIIKICHREQEGELKTEDIEQLPCIDLLTIDRLWIEYSQGSFGFSVQANIYQSVENTTEYDTEIWRSFGDRVGWRVNGDWLYWSDLKFGSTSPPGHLPCCLVSSLGQKLVLSRRIVSVIIQKINQCYQT